MAFLGKIYRIDFPDGYFYIGSTKHSLKTRLQAHKRDRMNNLKVNLKAGYKSRTRFDIYLEEHGWNNPTISLLEESIVNSLTELHQLENTYIIKECLSLKNLNHQCAGAIRPPTEMEKLCRLDNLLSGRTFLHGIPLKEFWVDCIITNWLITPFFYSFSDAYNAYKIINPSYFQSSDRSQEGSTSCQSQSESEEESS